MDLRSSILFNRGSIAPKNK